MATLHFSSYDGEEKEGCARTEEEYNWDQRFIQEVEKLGHLK